MSDIFKMNTCYPASIVEFDPVKQVASCKLSIESYYTGLDFSYAKQPAVTLLDVPVQFPQGGGWDITFPVKAGDPCMLLFSQRGYDHWLYEAKEEAGLVEGVPHPDFDRCFSARDAICILGPRPIPKAIPDFNNDGMELRNEAKSQRITFHSSGDVEITTTANVNINCAEANVNASGKAVVTTPDMTIDSPITKLTGDIQVAGNATIGGTIGVTGGASSGQSTITGTFQLNGSMASSGDIVAGGTSLTTHTHTGNGAGNPTSPPN